MSIENAFHEVCPNAIRAEGVYLTLYKTEQWYGGPEEGGWWGETTTVVEYTRFDTREQAERAHAKILARAEEMSEESRREHNEQMRRDCDWCERRGIDPADHPSGEPDGPDSFEVHIEQDLGSHAHSSDPYYS